MKSITSLFLFLFVVVGVSGVNANQEQRGYCTNAQSTADLVGCIGQHLSDENEKMATLYTEIEKYNADDNAYLTVLKSQQDEWLAFKDKQCDFESSSYKGGSLEHVQNLSCQARMTEGQVTHLTNILQSNVDANIPEFSSPPRWVNVLQADYGDVFWKLASTQMVDVDCDGQDERLTKGLRKNESGYEMILAIADSQKTGRPVMTIIDFDDTKDCAMGDDYSIEKLPEPKPENDVLKCVQRVHIKTQNCGDFILTKNDAIYQITKKEQNVEN